MRPDSSSEENAAERRERPDLRSPQRARNKDGRLELFMLKREVSTNEVWHRWQQTPGSDWSAWSSLGAPDGDPIIEDGLDVARNGDGRLEVFVNVVEEVWHRWQQTPGSDWSDWTPLGRPDPDDLIASLAVAPNADGRLLLVANPAGSGIVPTTPTTTTPPPASSHSLWQRTQAFPGDSSWTDWSPLVSTPGSGRRGWLRTPFSGCTCLVPSPGAPEYISRTKRR